MYRENTSRGSEEIILDLEQAIRDYNTTLKIVSKFILFANGFLVSCLTSRELQIAVFELMRAIFLTSLPDTLRATAEVFRVNPGGTIIFVIYLAVWVWYCPKMVHIPWMQEEVEWLKKEIRKMELPD